MQEKLAHIPAISCHHCKMTIERELAELEGIESVVADVQHKTVRIVWDAPLSWEEIVNKLEEIGYPPQQ